MHGIYIWYLLFLLFLYTHKQDAIVPLLVVTSHACLMLQVYFVRFVGKCFKRTLLLYLLPASSIKKCLLSISD